MCIMHFCRLLLTGSHSFVVTRAAFPWSLGSEGIVNVVNLLLHSLGVRCVVSVDETEQSATPLSILVAVMWYEF